MSMIGSRLLSEIVNEMHIHEPAEILERLDAFIVKSLRQKETDNNDGMDVSLVRTEDENDKTFSVTYAGAKRPLYYTDDDTIKTIEGTRRSIGGFQVKKTNYPFEQKSIHLKKGSMLYLSSDGFVDQCNKRRKKFGTQKLIHLLQQISTDDVKMQYEKINKELDNFQGSYQQRDDICLAGVRL